MLVEKKNNTFISITIYVPSTENTSPSQSDSMPTFSIGYRQIGFENGIPISNGVFTVAIATSYFPKCFSSENGFISKVLQTINQFQS